MKVGIVGSGLVGSTTAYTLVMRGIGREVVLVNRTLERARAEAADVRHAVPFAHALQVWAGGYEDLGGSQVVIITVGVPHTTIRTRLDLLEGNAAVLRDVIPQVLEHAPQAVLLIATNPVDVMTHLAAHIAAQYGVSSGRVIGSGTTLDTARFRSLIGERIGVDPHHVHGYVVGEHGDSEVPTWSVVTVGAVPLDTFCIHSNLAIDWGERDRITEQVRRAGYDILHTKGATNYGVSSALARITQVIISDQRAVLTVTTPLPEVEGVRHVSLSMPALVGGSGVIQHLPIALNEGERDALRASATVLRCAIDRLGLDGPSPECSG
ncbi:MAG TPA: L-lactate dehydrogenase [Aggregatilineaceae bacterium]|nr:L-lactate dehydrogenase [Aggregatilineaceae bacterium]